MDNWTKKWSYIVIVSIYLFSSVALPSLVLNHKSKNSTSSDQNRRQTTVKLGYYDHGCYKILESLSWPSWTLICSVHRFYKMNYLVNKLSLKILFVCVCGFKKNFSFTIKKTPQTSLWETLSYRVDICKLIKGFAIAFCFEKNPLK